MRHFLKQILLNVSTVCLPAVEYCMNIRVLCLYNIPVHKLVITGFPLPGDDGDNETPPAKKQPLPIAKGTVASCSSIRV